jgi:hemerythrin-like domain-containing protein
MLKEQQMSDVDVVLRQHHQELERRFQRVLDLASKDQQVALRQEWCRLVAELDEHITLEEAHFLPALGRQFPLEEAELRQQHSRIRSMIKEIGTELDLGLLTAERVGPFLTLLREHALREDRLLYPFASEHPDAGTLARRLAKLVGGLSCAA